MYREGFSPSPQVKTYPQKNPVTTLAENVAIPAITLWIMSTPSNAMLLGKLSNSENRLPVAAKT